jgi:hypothetical protein
MSNFVKCDSSDKCFLKQACIHAQEHSVRTLHEKPCTEPADCPSRECEIGCRCVEVQS